MCGAWSHSSSTSADSRVALSVKVKLVSDTSSDPLSSEEAELELGSEVGSWVGSEVGLSVE